MIDHGAVPIFVRLLASPSDDVREQVPTYLSFVKVCKFMHSLLCISSNMCCANMDSYLSVGSVNNDT